MSYFLTDEQEHELNLFLDEENRDICRLQLESDDVPEELKEIIRSTIEAGSPIPAFNPIHGYYSISFTPCEEGNRIYAHHHLSNKSKSLCDPSKIIDQLDDLLNTNTEQVEDINPEKLTVDDIESMFGPPPEEMVTFDQN
jgi:hypothetical protein